MNEGNPPSATGLSATASDGAAVTETQDDDQSTTPQPTAPPRPTVWFITACNSPIGVSVARQLIGRGDHVVAAVLPSEIEQGQRNEEFKNFLDEVTQHDNVDSDFPNLGNPQLKVVGLDMKSISACQYAVAEAVQHFQFIDVLFCCNSEALFGTVEELSQTLRTQSLVLDQFQVNFFGTVNIIKTLLPTFRAQRNGHVVLLTGITGHLGTPGLSMYCASQWAIEGYCDSLAYEVAPFNIKVSIVQSNIEISVLTNKMVSSPPMAAYMPPINPAPLPRRSFGELLKRITNATESVAGEEQEDAAEGGSRIAMEQEVNNVAISTSAGITSSFPSLPATFRANLIAETVHAIVAIGGHTNPPSRHIVGAEGVMSVKEKLKTVSEELEEFVECSAAVDL